MNRSIQVAAGKINSWLLPFLAFSIPVSTSAVAALGMLVVVFWLLEADFKRKWKEMASNKVCLAVFLYLGLYIIGLLWSDNISSGMEMFKKQWKLLLMPVFLTALSGEHRYRVMYSFVAGLLLMMVSTYLAWFDLLHYGGMTPEHPTRKLYHVVYNPMLAFGFYLVMHELLWGNKSTGWRVALAVIAVVMALNMFITEGRIGQLVFFVLLAVLLLQYFRRKLYWGIILTTLILPLLFFAGYKYSPTFHNRVRAAWEEIAQFNYNPQTSIGYRFHFWKISWEVFKDNPWIGVGTTDFKSEYWWKNRAISPRIIPTDNPHNQYFLIMCQFGILGLAALFGIFALQIRQAFIVEDQLRRIRQVFPVFFLVIMLTESYLIVSETSFLFSVFTALLFKNVGKEAILS